MPRGRIPLAWKNLTHEPRRLLVASGGIGFAVVLMCMQMGFRNALFDSTVELHRRLNADLVITSRAAYTLAVPERFTRRRIYQARACPGVAEVEPLYIENTLSVWKTPANPGGHGVRVLAFDPTANVLDAPGIAENAKRLSQPGSVLYDWRSKRDKYGTPQIGERTELASQAAEVVGEFSLGTDFVNDGNLVTSDYSFGRFFGTAGGSEAVLGRVDLGVVRVEPGWNAQDVQRELEAALPDDIKVQTLPEFIDGELGFWRRNTPIGLIFGMGTAMGFLVGVIICYQVLYSDIDDHMAEFATLKAMGYPKRYFVSMVLQQSLLLSLFGFVPGVIVSRILYAALASATGLLLDLTLARASVILILTVVMCVVSGGLAMRRIFQADPAELFR